jgi:hypothetical protein
MRNASEEKEARLEKTNEEPGSTLQEGEQRYQEIQKLAYELWEKRGSPAGTPDVDWHEAEQLLAVPEAKTEPMQPMHRGANQNPKN